MISRGTLREVCPNPSNPLVRGLQYKPLHYNAQAANGINSTAKTTATRMESTSKVTNLTAKT